MLGTHATTCPPGRTHFESLARTLQGVDHVFQDVAEDQAVDLGGVGIQRQRGGLNDRCIVCDHLVQPA